MNRINKIRNRLDVLDVIISFSMTYTPYSQMADTREKTGA